MANSVVHFEIFATNVERARKFYERVFGWQFEVVGPPDFYLIVTGPAADPGLKQGLSRNAAVPRHKVRFNGFRCTISVRSITESMSAVTAAAASCVRRSSRFRRWAKSPRSPTPRTTSSACGVPAAPPAGREIARRVMSSEPHANVSLAALRAYVEGYPQGGRIARHSHDLDQLALISQSAAIIETDDVYVVHPFLKALWLPAGVEHSVYSPRPVQSARPVFPPNSVRMGRAAGAGTRQSGARAGAVPVCGAASFATRFAACTCTRAARRALPAAKAESFSLPKPKSERARKLADHFTSRPEDGRALEIVAAEIGGASLRTFERLFVDETGLSLAAWRRQSRMLASLSLLAEGKSISEVARAVGYDSAAAFSTAFKQCFGMPPSSYVSG